MIVCTGKIKRSSNGVCRFSFSWSSPTSLQEDLAGGKFMVVAVFGFSPDFGLSPDQRPSPALWWGSCRWLCHVRICAPETIHGSEWHRSPRSTSSPSKYFLAKLKWLERVLRIDLVFALGEESTGRLETKRCFHLFQLPVVANPENSISEVFTVSGDILHCQCAWEFCLDILVADKLASRQAVLPLRSQLCNILPFLLRRCRPPLPSSFSSHHQIGDQEGQQDNIEPQHPEKSYRKSIEDPKRPRHEENIHLPRLTFSSWISGSYWPISRVAITYQRFLDPGAQRTRLASSSLFLNKTIGTFLIACNSHT